MKIQFCGAVRTVTGSRTRFEHKGFVGLVDMGLFQGPRELRDLNWDPVPHVKDVQCVILTHAHIDHSGALPRLVGQGWRGPIYCTRPTAALLKVMLLDAAKLQEEDARFANRSKHSSHDPALPLYTEADALQTLTLVKPLPWEEWTSISPHLSLRFRRNGHILGSALVQIEWNGGDSSRRLTMSGDLGNPVSEILRDPLPISETEVLVCESTYGDRRVTRGGVRFQLAEVVKKVIGRGGTLIVPAFSVGRTQDLLFELYQLRKSGEIPEIPVYLDSPMSNEVTMIYRGFEEELKSSSLGNDLIAALSPPNFHPVASADDSMLLCMSTEPKVVISASGMLQGGRVLHHLKMKLPDSKNGVLFVGFQSNGTKGRLLRNGIPKIRLHHQDIDVEAEIFSIDGFSAHADSDEILAWMRRMRKAPRLTLLNHGEEGASEALAYRIRRELGWRCEIPQVGQQYDLESLAEAPTDAKNL